MKNLKEEDYPYWDGEQIVNLEKVKELKKVDVKDIKQINDLIKSNWIYIANHGDKLLLGRI